LPRGVGVLLLLSVASSLPGRNPPAAQRSIFDVEGLRWDVYLDEVTGRPYYHHAESGRTEWTVDLPSATGTGAKAEVWEASLPQSLEGEVKASTTSTMPTSPDHVDDNLISSVFGHGTVPEGKDHNTPTATARERTSSSKTKRGRKSKRKSNGARHQPSRPVASDPSASVAWTLSRPSSLPSSGSLSQPTAPSPGDSSLHLDYMYTATGFEGYDDLFGLDDYISYLDPAFSAAVPAPLVPPDSAELHHLADPAGALRLEPLSTSLDSLEGVAFRHSFTTPLQSPVMSLGGSSAATLVAGLEAARQELEQRLQVWSEDPEAWEQLGHVWRHYGNVPRTIDCYRKALILTGMHPHQMQQAAQHIQSSVLVSIAGVLGQMNFIEDALVVLDVFLDAEDITTIGIESNQAVGYMMAAQYYMRLGDTPGAAAALDAATLIQPKLKSVVAGVDQDTWQAGHVASGSWGTVLSSWDNPQHAGSAPGSWITQQDPWLALRIAAVGLGAMDFVEDAVARMLQYLLGLQRGLPPLHLGEATYTYILAFAEAAPRTTAMLRKAFNAMPCVLSGIASRAIADYGWGTALSLRLHRLLPGIPVGEVPMYLGFPLFLGHSFSLSTEFTLVDCIVFLFVGAILAPYLLPATGKRYHFGVFSVRFRPGKPAGSGG